MEAGPVSAVVGRFAPSPSGRLHLGNLACSLLAWLSARSRGGRIVLRIEDLDAYRAGLRERVARMRRRADAARLLLATAQAAAQRPGKALITMSMGRDGAVPGCCGGAFGSAATFGTLSAASAPGQPPADVLKAKLITAPL